MKLKNITCRAGAISVGDVWMRHGNLQGAQVGNVRSEGDSVVITLVSGVNMEDVVTLPEDEHVLVRVVRP